MTQLDDHRLLELARAIDDELPIDWHAAEGSMPDAAGRAVILELQVLESMARVARDPEGALTTSTATHPSAPLPVAAPSSQWGPLTLLEPIGEGYVGQVFKARRQTDRQVVALKVIRPERRADEHALHRFRREIQSLAQLDHPNIVSAYDVDEIGVAHYYAMEFVDGIDLERILVQTGPLPIAPACDFCGVKIVGHGMEGGGKFYCCAHCAQSAGKPQMKDRVA